MNRPSVNGGTALITSLIILALVIFSMLSLTGYQADERMFERMKAASVEFYSAECKANEWLGHLRDTGAAGEYEKIFETVPGQGLWCGVRLDGSGQYEILYWALVRTVPWEGDYTLPVYQEE